MRRDEAELGRLQKRLDVLYDDRLDGRIDTTTYDTKAQEIRQLAGPGPLPSQRTPNCRSTRLSRQSWT
jgi:hypothetical protein